jgi:hypothetical protein
MYSFKRRRKKERLPELMNNLSITLKITWLFRWFVSLIGLTASLILVGFASAESFYQEEESCEQTPYLSENELPDPIISTTTTWYGNTSLAAGLAPAYYGEWYAGEPGIILMWWRDVPGELEIDGTRLDGPAEPLVTHAPRGYLDHGYEATGVLFPSPGCWEVTGRVGDTQISFVVWVNPAEEHPIHHDWTDDRCPITPHLPFHEVTSYTVPPAGEFPVWLTIGERFDFERYPRSLPPYEGIWNKFLIFVDRRVEGQLSITGRQLDGDGIVLFPHDGTTTTTEDGVTGALYDEVSDEEIIEDAHITTIVKPPDSPVAEHGAVVIFPNPGCYAVTATLTGADQTYTVRVVTEVVGDSTE